MDELNTQHLNMALHSFLIREWCEGWHFAHMWKTCTSSHNFTNSNGLGRADQFDPVTLLVTDVPTCTPIQENKRS